MEALERRAVGAKMQWAWMHEGRRAGAARSQEEGEDPLRFSAQSMGECCSRGIGAFMSQAEFLMRYKEFDGMLGGGIWNNFVLFKWQRRRRRQRSSERGHRGVGARPRPPGPP
jgi:hypothetical protein